MLHPFRGRCGFIQYMPMKPAKYGLKVMACCDAKTYYTGNLEVYCGQQVDGPYKVSNSALDVVKRLTDYIKNENRNLTVDNWYTSHPLATDLLQNKITLIGMIRKNKKEIPPQFLPHKERQEGTTIFGFQKDMTLVSYCPRRNKAVLLLSTMHQSLDIDAETQKPQIILDYNATKGAVDTVDRMCSQYSVSRISKRWPLALFFILLNIAGINAQILYCLKNDESHLRRRIFLKNLALRLTKEHLVARANMYTLPADVTAYLKQYRTEEKTNLPSSSSKRGRCRICPNSTTTIKCETCKSFICKKHSSTRT
ncbi:MAG TPA: hypothetical protein ACHBZA_03745, partial [Arsenophonus apicola]